MKRFLTVTLPLILLIFLSACSESVAPTVSSVSDMPGKTVGVVSGGNTENYLKSTNMKLNVLPYGDTSAAAAALKSGTVDCVVAAEADVSDYTGFLSGFDVLDEPLGDVSLGFMVAAARGDLAQALDRVMISLEEDGTIEKIIKSYMGGKEYRYEKPKNVEYTSLLTIGFCESAPYAYYGSSGEVKGLEVDIMRTICDAAGIEVSFKPVTRANAESSVIKGETDVVIGGFYETGLSSPLVGFSKGYISDTLYVITRK